MAKRPEFALNEFYHLYNRGVEGRDIYIDINDYRRAVVLLFLANKTARVDIDGYFQKGLTFLDLWDVQQQDPRVEIGAWCLMPNHFHIFVREIKDGGISEFMKIFSTAYSMYFNAKYKRQGRLTQGSYKAEHINNDRYFQYLFSYIHLNPVKLIRGESAWKEEGIKNQGRVKKFLDTYTYSSFFDYKKGNLSRVESKILTNKNFPWKFGTIGSMEQDTLSWLSQKG